MQAWTFDITRGIVDLQDMPFGAYRVEAIGVDREPFLNDVYPRQELPTRDLDSSQELRKPVILHRIESNLAALRCSITAGPAGSLFTTERYSALNSWRLSPGNPAMFTAWYQGYMPVAVDEGDFMVQGDEAVAGVTFHPGWGVQLVFREGDPTAAATKGDAASKVGQPRDKRRPAEQIPPGFAAPPLPGVLVRSHGDKLGTSDANGSVLLGQTLMPDRLSLVAEGWRLAALERMPGAGSRWWVWMKRDP
jgi:hypothetical protein